MFVILTYKKVL